MKPLERSFFSFKEKKQKKIIYFATAQTIKEIMPTLTDEEADIVRRARNAKPQHTAKNATSADYSYATALTNFCSSVAHKNILIYCSFAYFSLEKSKNKIRH